MGTTSVVEQIVALERCERCGMVQAASGHHSLTLCDAAAERRRLWADGWVDLEGLWPDADATAAEPWAASRPGPGFRKVFDGLGLRELVVERTTWVRHHDVGTTGLSVAACVGLHALRPDRSGSLVARQVLGMEHGGLRSLARPQGFEIPVGCHDELHRLSVLDGRLLPIDHPELKESRRPKHRRTVHRDRWIQSLTTTPAPLLLDGVPVAAGPDGHSCAQLIETWNAGLHDTFVFDVSVDHGTWTSPPRLAATLAAGAVLERTARARLLLALVEAAGSDVAADLQVRLLPPGADSSIALHHRVSGLQVSLPSDEAADERCGQRST
jgi:hypothetical protein